MFVTVASAAERPPLSDHKRWQRDANSLSWVCGRALAGLAECQSLGASLGASIPVNACEGKACCKQQRKNHPKLHRFIGERAKLSDGGRETRRLQPRRSAAVRRRAWFGLLIRRGIAVNFVGGGVDEESSPPGVSFLVRSMAELHCARTQSFRRPPCRAPLPEVKVEARILVFFIHATLHDGGEIFW